MAQPPWPVAASEQLYRLLLGAYPSAFRRDYGPHMAQVFRDGCRAAWRSHGVPGLLAVWGHTMPDLLTSGLHEHAATVVSLSKRWERRSLMPKQPPLERLAPYPLILLLGLAVGWLNLHTDETPFIALPLFTAAVLVGAINPRHAWRWGLALACCLPLSQVVAASIGMRLPYPNVLPGDLGGPLIGGLLFGLAGAYCGVLARWVVAQVRPTTTHSSH